MTQISCALPVRLVTVRFVVVFDWFLVIPSLLAGFCQICWISALFAVVKISNRKIKLTSTDKIQIIQLILAVSDQTSLRCDLRVAFVLMIMTSEAMICEVVVLRRAEKTKVERECEKEKKRK